ncbi:DUF3137 domain-containing protein [Candidatus Peregrinibacteria bacterium]|nr:MAG: DUF3137 domain-containing protein [Candidatus Peregrinibacteria bacterium]
MPKEEQKSEVFWDPVGEKITHGQFASDRKKLEQTLEKYQKNPTGVRKNALIFSVPAVATIVWIVLNPSIIATLAELTKDGDGVFLLFLPFVLIALYIGYIFRVQRQLVKILVAKTQGWVFAPSDHQYKRGGYITKKYPEISQYDPAILHEEFWGSILYKRKKINFWIGAFIVISTKQWRNRGCINTVFALPLDKKLSSNFQLEPEGIKLKLFNNFFRSNKNEEIDTESIDFNASYTVFYNGRKIDNQIEIVKVLSPSVQTRLINLSRKWKCTIIFREDVVLFSLKGRFLSWWRMKTNFFRKVELDPRDQKMLEDQISEFAQISSDITRFLD